MTADGVAYEFRVHGHLDIHWADWLGDVTIDRNDDGTSTLTSRVADQAQLHGFLTGIRDLGAALLSVNQVAATSRAQAGPRNLKVPTLKRPVRTERLTLRPPTIQDADATWAYRSLPSVGEWLTEIPTDLTAYRATFAESERLAATVAIELDGQLIGDFMLQVEDAWAQSEVADQARNTQAELGWVLDPAFTGHGYATEAVRGLIEVCFRDLGVRRIVANCFMDNETSWRLMERVGMRRETNAIAESLHRSGRWLDTVAYAILADEWADHT